MYAGFGSRDGANQYDAPLVFGSPVLRYRRRRYNPDVIPADYAGYVAGNDVTTRSSTTTQAFENQLPIKLFADLTYNDLEVWARYTRSGTKYTNAPRPASTIPQGYGEWVSQGESEAGTQQVTVQSQYQTELTEDLKMQARVGWDSSDFVNIVWGTEFNDAYRENELNARLLFTLDLDENTFAFGGEFYNDWYGRRGHLIDHPATVSALGADYTPWETQTYSLMFEDQWQVNDDFTVFMGSRWDKNTYTPWMNSPRLALIWTPNKCVTWKGLLNRSLRMNFAEELRNAWIKAAA